jgi:SWI/SNF-related matrix-associated actin-dependent regulator of chromatin subfamily A-like protein 1
MAHYQHEWPLLILCPASLRHTWPAEIEKFIPELPPSAVHVVSGFDDADFYARRGSIQIVVATYSLLQTRSAAARVLAQFDFQCVIADESHSLKERTSQRCQIGMPLLEKAKRLVLLSGTPALARPVELWAQMSCIAPDLFGSYNYYTKQYCNARRGRFGYDVSGLSNADELHQKLRQVMVRRLKSDVLKELPPKQRSIIPIKISAESANACRDLMTDLKETRVSVDDLVGQDAASAHFEARHLLMMAYQQSGIGKAKSVGEFLLDWLTGSGTQKILVFAHHKDVMDVLEQAVAKKFKGGGHMRIDGSVPPKERALRVKKFQTSPNIRVAILSMTAAGVGLTLTAASSVLFAELHWTPGVLAQAEDRCHRIGQVNAVNVMYAVCKDQDMSVDMTLWGMLGRKVGNLGKVIDGCRDASMGATMTIEGVEPSGGGESAQDELTRFFSETPAEENKRLEIPVKGSIMSFFKPAASSSSPNKTLATVPGPSATTVAARVSMDTGDSKPLANALLTPLPNQSAINSEVTWSCDACTFINTKVRPKSGYLACNVCHTPHLDESTSARHVTPTAASTKKLSPLVGMNATTSHTKRQRFDADVMMINEKSKATHTQAVTSAIINIDDDGDICLLVTPSKSLRPASALLQLKSPPLSPNYLKFSVSKNSGRITIHNATNDESFLVSFELTDVLSAAISDKMLEAQVQRGRHTTMIPLEFDDGSIHCLIMPVIQAMGPTICHNIREKCSDELKEFCKCYSDLREIEKKTLKESGQAFSAQKLRQTVAKLSTSLTNFSTERYCGGAKERAQERLTQGVERDPDQAVLEGKACAWCAGTLPPTSLARGVQSTYCSQKCAEEGRLKRGGMYAASRIREEVFALEGGVCCKCGLDAHALFVRLTALQPAERLNALVNANWGLPKASTALERLLQHPTEGDFWQADHIVAVSEGGGGCDLQNLQTLCTPCHKVETSKLRGRLKLNGGVASTENASSGEKRKQMDIRSSFLVPRK